MTTQQAFELALQHHQAGRLTEAEALYRQILATDPRHAQSLHLLGAIASQAGRNDVAVTLIRRAIAIAPNDSAFHYNLGLALRELGCLEECVAAYQQAVRIKPDYAMAYNNLGSALKELGRVETAFAAFQQALRIEPHCVFAANNVGNIFREQGRLDEAVAAYRQALHFQPDYAEALGNLGGALAAQGDLNGAIAAYDQSLRFNPHTPEVHNNHGIALSAQSRFADAIVAHRQALLLKPEYAEAHYHLGIALLAHGRLEDAVGAFQEAIQDQPDYAEAYNNLGCALNAQGRPSEAIAAYRRAIEINPDYGEAHANLGLALPYVGQVAEAVASYRRAMVLRPRDFMVHSHLIHTLLFQCGKEGASIDQELRNWESKFAEPFRRVQQPYDTVWNPERRLRIGYVSPDFRHHVVGENVISVLERHDHKKWEVFCYSNVTKGDDLTDRFRGSCDVWRNIATKSDGAAAELIRSDRIDILIDLTLHMANHRLLVFAREPAHLQVTWAGYPGSTGLEAIDYRITDPYLDPPGESDEHYSEKSVRLPHSFWCYNPSSESPLVNPLPAHANNRITFGSLNNYCKVNEEVLELWARVLRAVKDSRLLLLSLAGSHRQHALAVFQDHGVAADRIEWFSPASRQQYLEQYHHIDIGLDTFPYNGHTTSLDSFWMGVPVITLVGNTIVGRAGLSQAMNLGLPELVTRTPEQYVHTAINLTRDLPKLAILRSTLRQRMQASPLMDARGFTADLETAYRTMWRQRCAANNF